MDRATDAQRTSIGEANVHQVDRLREELDDARDALQTQQQRFADQAILLRDCRACRDELRREAGLLRSALAGLVELTHTHAPRPGVTGKVEGWDEARNVACEVLGCDVTC